MRNVAIIGAGISGLALAWFLRRYFQKKLRITIYEKSDRVGGAIRTTKIGRYLFEQGPHSLRTRGSGIQTLRLIEQLRLQDEVIFSPSKGRYLYLDGQLQKIPAHFLSLLTSKLIRPHLATIFKEICRPRGTVSDETIYDFVVRRFDREIAIRFFDPMVTGVFAGDLKELSMRSCFPSLFHMERTYGSVIKGAFYSIKRKRQKMSPFIKAAQKFPLFSLSSGLETLPLKIAEAFSEEIHFQSSIVSMEPCPGGICLHVAGRKAHRYDHVFCALHPGHLKKLIPCAEVPLASMAIVHVGYQTRVLPHKGFGYLVPSSEQEQILGAVWDSDVFPQQNAWPNQTRLSVMIGGARMKQFAECSDRQFKEWALSCLSKHLQIRKPPDEIAVHRLPRVIPQYLLGHRERVGQWEAKEPNMTFLGYAYYGISVNDCVNKAEQIANACYTQARAKGIRF